MLLVVLVLVPVVLLVLLVTEFTVPVPFVVDVLVFCVLLPIVAAEVPDVLPSASTVCRVTVEFVLVYP